MKEKLFNELKWILNRLNQPATKEILAPTWSSIKPTDIPTRIDHHILDGLSLVHLRLETYNYFVRQERDLSITEDLDREKKENTRRLDNFGQKRINYHN